MHGLQLTWKTIAFKFSKSTLKLYRFLLFIFKFKFLFAVLKKSTERNCDDVRRYWTLLLGKTFKIS